MSYNLPHNEPAPRADERNSPDPVQHLQNLYRARYGEISRVEHWADLAQYLSSMVGKSPPWSARYVRSVAHRNDGFSPPPRTISKAILSAKVEDQERQMTEVEALVVTDHRIPNGTIVTASPRQCQWCGVWFIPPYANQLYHDHECRRLAKNKRARERRKLAKKG